MPEPESHTSHVTFFASTIARILPAEGPVPSLVFPELVEGHYELYLKETHDVELLVDVTGGEVSTAHWPR